MTRVDTLMNFCVPIRSRTAPLSKYYRCETSLRGCRSYQNRCRHSGLKRFNQGSTMHLRLLAIYRGRAWRFKIVVHRTFVCKAPWHLRSMCSRIEAIRIGTSCLRSRCLSFGHFQESCRLCQAQVCNGHLRKSRDPYRLKFRSRWLTGSSIPMRSQAAHRYDL
jgi:hypothetical protein